MRSDDVLDERVELGVLADVDEVGLVGAPDRAVRWDLNDVEVVDLLELTRLGDGGSRHPGELVVHPEVVLKRDRGERLVLFLDLHALFGLDRLMEALGVAASLEHASGELVDDLDLAVADEIVDVPRVELLRLQADVEVMDQVDVGVVVHVLDAEDLLDTGDAFLGRDDLTLLLVNLVVVVPPQALRDPGEVSVVLGSLPDSP